MSNYTLVGDKFIIDNYDTVPAFSSFLPGIAGVIGIPIWAFYTNRGQGINSFGIHHKGNAIMEFNSANTAYENTPVKGFRTFVKVNGNYFEPFCGYVSEGKRTALGVVRRMEIEKNTFTLVEERKGLRITVNYVVLPGESIGALVRSVTVTNMTEAEVSVEVLDGMPQIIPYGIQNGQYKEMSNLFKSWADIKNIENHAPVYAMRASSDDSAEVSEILGGYFYFAQMEGNPLPIIYDKNVIFGFDNSMVTPVNFVENGVQAVVAATQCFANKVPCGFAPVEKTLAAGESLKLAAFIGFASSEELLNKKTKDFCKAGYVEAKVEEARNLVDSFTKDIRTKTGKPLFDQYMEQCYLDNFLRGGYPFVIGQGDKKSVVHLFSRKHGDPERDYNFFSTAGEYYSQGNGNYRDVCQNRRNDVFFNPAIEDFNVRHFFSLVQMDGYNPLEIRPCTFVIQEGLMQKAQVALKNHVADPEGKLDKVIAGAFTPGQITNTIAQYQLTVIGSEQALVEELLEMSTQQLEAGFGEGYWSDHWDYNLDLVENYLLIYPEKKEQLLYGFDGYKYYDSVGVVRPRKDTYVINKGRVRQYGSMEHCEEKASMPGFRANATNWLKDAAGKEITSTLFGKMMTLAVNKFALLDSYGMGVEMEGGKPGWNDAMNGLPGLFGSSMPETMELKRLVDFMVKEAVSKDGKETLTLTSELVDFMRDIMEALESGLGDFEYWDRVASLREDFRELVKFSVSGQYEEVSFEELTKVLTAFADKLKTAVDKALEFGEGIMPTYFTFEATDFEEVINEDGTPRISPYGLPSAKVNKLEIQKLPRFLEGPARMLSACEAKDMEVARAMCAKIKETDIYDKKLKMYKTSESIEEVSMENGRVRAFTPGWLERESVFLHMEYKYFLGMFKAGLYEEFYEAIGGALIPYQNPEVYGRSILENSSFLASSANPDEQVHGQGFVARLSGSTVEMLSMWIGMFLGNKGFYVEDGLLKLQLDPKLSGDMFDEEGLASFTLCGNCKVTYHNPAKVGTFGQGAATIQSMEVWCDGSKTEVAGAVIAGDLAAKVREGKVERIEVFM